MTTLDGSVQKFAEHYWHVNGFWPTTMVNGPKTGRPHIERLSSKTLNRNRLYRMYVQTGNL